MLSDTLAEQSSQWDGFRHYSQPFHTSDPSSSKDRIYYGGTTKAEIMDSANYRIGIQHWASEGIAGEYSNFYSLAGSICLPKRASQSAEIFLSSRSRDTSGLPHLGFVSITADKLLVLLNTFSLLSKHSSYV